MNACSAKTASLDGFNDLEHYRAGQSRYPFLTGRPSTGDRFSLVSPSPSASPFSSGSLLPRYYHPLFNRFFGRISSHCPATGSFHSNPFATQCNVLHPKVAMVKKLGWTVELGLFNRVMDLTSLDNSKHWLRN